MKKYLCIAVLISFFQVAGAQSLIISEFRLRGSSGARDEFLEIYNNSDIPLTVNATDGSAGFSLAASDGVARFTIPNGTVIPARGHYLGVNSTSYSIGNYPAGNGATTAGDATYTTDIPDNAGVALFNTSNPVNFILANRLDAVGSVNEANTLYKEGAGYPVLTPFNIDYCFHRRIETGLPQDTDNNAADFKFEDTNGTSAGAGQSLGTSGPENLSSPISGTGIIVTLADTTQPSYGAPNFIRDLATDPANNSTLGKLDFRLKIQNISGVAITSLRFRITDISTFPSPDSVADLRPLTSSNIVANISGIGSVTVFGTTLDQPPSQFNGGGFNSSLSVNNITPGTPLANNAVTYVRILIGSQQNGAFRSYFVLEGLPGAGGGTAGSGAGVTTPFGFYGKDKQPYMSGIATAALGDVIISEFRLRGPSGANDEFIELYNKTNNPISMRTTDGSSGWALATSAGTIKVIANGTVIPAKGHILVTNSLSYSIASYPANIYTSTGDFTYTSDIPDNAGIALFNTATSGNFSLATRMDAVGSVSEANTLYKEGVGYPSLTPFSIGYAFVRDACGKQGSITNNVACTTSEPIDANNNATDFIFVDDNGTSAGAGQRLGAASPENLYSPVTKGKILRIRRADTSALIDLAPNYVRDLTSVPANNSTFGTSDIRIKIKNLTSVAITRLRLRVIDLTTFPAPFGFADLRPLTSVNVTASIPGSGSVTVLGTTLDIPPTQPNGGGFNSSWSVPAITAATPLQPGDSLFARMVLGVQQTGIIRVGIALEALPYGGTSDDNNNVPGYEIGGTDALPFALPISFMTFTGKEINNTVRLDWTTSREINLDRFEVYRSLDGIQFTKIGATPAIGNTGSLSHYVFNDANPAKGKNFYRIIAFDKDGKSTSTGVIKITLGSKVSGITAYTNGVSNVLNLQMSNVGRGYYNLKLFNSIGQFVCTTTLEHSGGTATYQLPLTVTLTKGTYFLSLAGTEETYRQSLIVQ